MTWNIYWHYHTATKLQLQVYSAKLANLRRYIGFGLLIKSLFAPWKRQEVQNTKKGFSLSAKWETGSFNAISRLVGFVIRANLIIYGGLFWLFYALFLGLYLLIFWLIPPLSIRLFAKWINQPENQIYPQSGQKLALTPFGQFFSAHTGITTDELAIFQLKKAHLSTMDLVNELLEQHLSPQTLQSHYLESTDLLVTARWWEHKLNQKSKLLPDKFTGRSLALDFSQGYTPTLDKYSTTLKPAAAGFAQSEILKRINRGFSTGNNLLLFGVPGIGKKTLLSQLAQLHGHHLVFKEVNFNDLLSQVLLDINSKKQVLNSALKEGAAAGNTVLVVKDLHRFTHSGLEGFDFTDTLESILESRKLQLVALSTNSEYERYLAPNARLRKLFDVVEVREPSQAETMDILIRHANKQEETKKITILAPALRHAYNYSLRYINDLPQPQKSLKLLDIAVTHTLADNQSSLNKDQILKAVSEVSGVQVGTLNTNIKNKLANLETHMKNRLIGQDLAIDLIARSLRSRSTGMSSESKPTGSFLFLGPTGVGKTETAKSLAEAYYGSETNFIRFDMAEFAHRDGAIKLLGSPENNQPGQLATSIKSRPDSILLLDEIEKAPAEIYNVFLTLLDEGYITDAFGQKINCTHTLVIATSNAASEYIRELVNQGITNDRLQQMVVEHVLSQGWFSPEFINRFDSVVVYQPLTEKNLASIAQLQLNRLTYRLKQQNITLQITDTVVPKICSLGYNPTFGARPMRRIIDLVIGDLFSKGLIDGSVNPSDKLLLYVNTDGNFAWQKQS